VELLATVPPNLQAGSYVGVTMSNLIASHKDTS
jgi:hypothetical protein